MKIKLKKNPTLYENMFKLFPSMYWRRVKIVSTERTETEK